MISFLYHDQAPALLNFISSSGCRSIPASAAFLLRSSISVRKDRCLPSPSNMLQLIDHFTAQILESGKRRQRIVIDRIVMTANDVIKTLWEKRACHDYEGDEPYIYLSFAPFEMAEGLITLSILNEAGCRVRYDENMLTGRPWTGGICDAIEGAAVFFEVNGPEYHFSLAKDLAYEFAHSLGGKHITVRLSENMPEKRSGYPALIYSSLKDPSYPERCRQGLEAAGYFSAQRVEPSAKKYDLMLDYYLTKEDRDLAFGGLLPQSLNLRTHESHGYLGHHLRSDEDVYSAVRYSFRKERFYLCRRSPMEDYRPGRADKLFMEKVRKMNGADPEDLERKYASGARIPKPWGPFPAGYPYKDEFDYLSSDEE